MSAVQATMASSARPSGMKTSQKFTRGSTVDMSHMTSSQTFKKASSLRKSTGNLAAHFPIASTNSITLSKSTSDLERIEAEYIKNLQQQVYFLELEANFLREEVRKANEQKPQMLSEARSMVTKISEREAELEQSRTEIKVKLAALEVASMDKEKLLGKLKAADDSHQREKRLLLDEITQLKKEKELLEKSINNKDAQIIEVQHQLETSNSNVRTNENKIRLLESQLGQKSDQTRLLQQTVDEKRAELVKSDARLREVEEKYYSSPAMVNDKVKDDLREEIRLMKQKLKEVEMNAAQDRYLRTKLSDDSAHLVKENAVLSQQVLELEKQLDRERGLRETTDSRRSQNFTEFSTLKDQENHIRLEMEQTREHLKGEQEKVKQLMEQLAKQEQLTTSNQLSLTTTRSKLAELNGQQDKTGEENKQLRRENKVLTVHVDDLQKQVNEKQTSMVGMQERIHSLETKLKNLEHLQELQSSIHSQKWDEFSRLAESMKTLSRSMAQNSTGAPTTPWTTNLLDYA